MSILLWFICMVFIYNTTFWKQIYHFTYIVAGKSSHLLIRAGTEYFVGKAAVDIAAITFTDKFYFWFVRTAYSVMTSCR